MNYINITTEGAVSLFLNLKITTELAVASTLVWTMTKDGNDVADVNFSTPSANYNLLANNGYSQRLSADFYTDGLTLENNAFYAIKATLDGENVVTDIASREASKSDVSSLATKANQEIINIGVKKSSKLQPHSNNVII